MTSTRCLEWSAHKLETILHLESSSWLKIKFTLAPFVLFAFKSHLESRDDDACCAYQFGFLDRQIFEVWFRAFCETIIAKSTNKSSKPELRVKIDINLDVSQNIFYDAKPLNRSRQEKKKISNYTVNNNLTNTAHSTRSKSRKKIVKCLNC